MTVGSIVDRIVADRSITRVDHLVDVIAIDKRPLQRLFRQYVGVSPKWVIQRYRLHEALERIQQGTPADWAGLAQTLGYADQAHFIRDFKRLIGTPPAAYVGATELSAPPARPIRGRRPTTKR